MPVPTTFSPAGAVVRPLVRDVTLSQASVMLTIALDVAGLFDKPTLARFRAAITSNIAAFLDRSENPVWTFTLELDATPPKPLLAAAFSIRVRWSEWFDSLSPAGAPVRVTIRDDRASRVTPAPALPAAVTLGIGRSPSPVPSLGRSSSCSSMRSAASGSTAPSSVHSAECSPTLPLSELGNHSLGNGTFLLQEQQRRVRRQRGGVKQKQRGIHVDKNKIDVTPYDNGITGVLTGGVMLGRRTRPAQFTVDAPHAA